MILSRLLAILLTSFAVMGLSSCSPGTPVEVIGVGSLAVTEEAIPLGEQPIAAAFVPRVKRAAAGRNAA